jgi:hypothetical protein
VTFAKVGGASCGCIAALVDASTPPTVPYAEVGGIECAVRTALVDASTPPTMSFTEAAFFCILLTARWVLTPTAHGKSTKVILSLSLYLSLFNL